MKKILLIVLLIFLVAIVGAAIYMHTVFIPVTLKAIIEEQGREFLGRSISYTQLRYSLSKGISLEGLKIQQKDNPQETLLSVAEVKFNVLLLPFLKNRTVIIPTLTLTAPEAALTRNTENIWNIQDLLQPKKSSGTSMQVILTRVLIKDGTLKIMDETGMAAPLHLTPINTDVSLSLPQSIDFKFDAGVKDSATALTAEGSYRFDKKSLVLTAGANSLDCVPSILPFLGQKSAFELLTVHAAQIKAEWQPSQWFVQGDARADIKTTLGANTTLQAKLATHLFRVSFQNNTWDLTADTLSGEEANVQSADGSWAGGFTATGLSSSFNPESLSVKITSLASEKPGMRWDDHTLTGDSLKLIDAQLSKRGADFTSQGQIHIINADLKSNGVRAQGDLVFQQLSLEQQNGTLKLSAPLSLTESDLEINEELTISGPIRISKLDLTHDKKTLTLTAQLNDGLLTATMANGIKASGTTRADVSLTRVSSDGNAPLTYTADLWLKDTTLNGIKGADAITGIQGKLSVNTNSVQTDGLTFKIFDVPATASGSIRDFKNFQSELLVTAQNVALAPLVQNVKTMLNKDLPVSLEGKTDLEITVRGPLKVQRQIEYDVEARLKNASLASPSLPKPLTEIYGLLRYKTEFISWQDWAFKYDGQDYTSTGALRNFSNPAINIRLKNKDLTLSAFAKSENKVYEFSRFEIQGKNSMLKATGSIDAGNPGLKADILAESRLDLSELNSLPQSLQKFLAPINPRGTAYLKAQFNGPLKDPLNGTFAINYQSELMRLYGYRIDNLSVDASMSSNKKTTWTVNSNFYSGLLNIQAKMDMSDPLLSGQIQASLKRADLAALKNDSPLKEKPMSGTLDINLTGYGPLKDMKKFTGNGEISISNGHIWTANLLKGVWEHILIQDYRNIDFTGGNSKFQIKDNRFNTNSLFLYSKPLNLEGQGWIDFSKNIDLDIYPDFKMTEILVSSDINKGFSSAMAQTRGFLSIKLYGTIDSPKHKVMTHPEVLIKKGAESALEGAGVIFEEVQDIIGDMIP